MLALQLAALLLAAAPQKLDLVIERGRVVAARSPCSALTWGARATHHPDGDPDVPAKPASMRAIAW
jgi:hypothetical protein